MFKRFIEWLEGDVSRARKVALMSTIFVFLFLTTITFLISYFGIVISQGLITIYITFTTLMGSIFAFYTSTRASTDSSVEQDKIDVAVGKVLDRLKKYSKGI